jgi:membrane protein implicated in regulation of membrane protease activity
MAAYWIWWIMAGGLVAAELVTGTFFLLAVGVAFAIGGLAAFLGASFEVQLLVAGALALAGTLAAHRWRQRKSHPPPDPAFDIGQSVRVQAWNADGTARVAYRGTLWVAEPVSASTPRVDTMYIVGLRGSTLVISDRRA